MGCRVYDFGFGVQGLGFTPWGFEFKDQRSPSIRDNLCLLARFRTTWSSIPRGAESQPFGTLGLYLGYSTPAGFRATLRRFFVSGCSVWMSMITSRCNSALRDRSRLTHPFNKLIKEWSRITYLCHQVLDTHKYLPQPHLATTMPTPTPMTMATTTASVSTGTSHHIYQDDKDKNKVQKKQTNDVIKVRYCIVACIVMLSAVSVGTTRLCSSPLIGGFRTGLEALLAKPPPSPMRAQTFNMWGITLRLQVYK